MSVMGLKNHEGVGRWGELYPVLLWMFGTLYFKNAKPLSM